MTTSNPQSHIVQKDEYGGYASGEPERELTDELIAYAKTLVGARLRVRDGWNTEATRDAIRHYAQAHGMDDPLYSDPGYAQQTRWGGIVAPPTFPCHVAEEHDWTPEEIERSRDPFGGIHSWYAGTHTQFFRPVHVGDVITAREFQGDFIEKKSQFSGRTIIDYKCSEFLNQRGELVRRQTSYIIRGGRQKKWGERSKYADIQPQTYTPEEIAKIEEDYERMEVRGADTRYWEEVQVGDVLTPTVYGPMTVTDMVARNSGTGLSMTGSAAFKVAYELRKHVPKLFLINDAGIPDTIESVHWDHGISQRTGNPLAYDYGLQRAAFLAHVVTNWVGDDGWLRMYEHALTRFAYVGDTIWAKGRVTGKRQEDGHNIVEIEIWCEDQRGRVTANGTAEAALPSREHGPVVIPQTFTSPPPGWYIQ